MRRALGLVAVALLVAGCAGGPDQAVPAGGPAEPAGVPASLWPEPSAESEPSPTLVPGVTNCDGFDGVIAGYGIVDAALGHRYMTMTLLNCGEEPFEVAAPVIHGIGPTGDETLLIVDVSGEPLTLGYEELGYIHLHWLSNGRCERGVQELTLAIGEHEFSHVDPERCFQLGGDYAPERPADIDAELSLESHPS